MIEINKKPILKRKVAISTSIVNSQYNLEVGAKNIIYLAVASINQFQKIEPGTWHKVNLNDFATLMGDKIDGQLIPTRKNNTKLAIINAVKELYESSIKFTNVEGIKEEHRWIKAYKELDSEDNIHIKWNEELLPHLAELKTYANLIAKDMIGIKGKYTSRILELVSQGKHQSTRYGKIYVPLEDFLYMIEAGTTYSNYKYLKQFVLKPSIAELIKNKIVSIELKEKRVDRKIIGFEFIYNYF